MENAGWTLDLLLEELDGMGLVITDQEVIGEALNKLGFSGKSRVEFDPEFIDNAW